MKPFGKDTAKSKSISIPTSRESASDDKPAATGATPAKPGRFKFLDSIGVPPSLSLHLPVRKGGVVADLKQWGLTPKEAERIADQDGYLAAHGPALADAASGCIDLNTWTATKRPLRPEDQKNLFTVCQAWAAVAPKAACRLINVALPLLPDSSVHALLVQYADQLTRHIDAKNAGPMGDAIVKLAKGGWSTPNSPGFVPEDERLTLTALAHHISPVAGLRVKLEDARLRLESASLDELPDLMAALGQYSAQAMRTSDKEVAGLLSDIRDLADQLARRADTEALRTAARQINVDAQAWRLQRAETHMGPWLTIKPVLDLQTNDRTVKATVNRPVLDSLNGKPRAKAQKWFREWLRAQLELPEDLGLAWKYLMDVVRQVAGDPPGDSWLGPEHWVELKLREALRSGDWTPIIDHLVSHLAIGTAPLQRVLKKLNECADPAQRADTLKAMLPHLPPPTDHPALHAQYLSELWHLASAQAPAGSELWKHYTDRHPQQRDDRVGQFAEHVMKLLAAAQTGTREQRQVAVMTRILGDFPKPRAGTPWLTWEPACRALLNAAIAHVPDPLALADLLIRWLPQMASVPTEKRLDDIERQFTLLQHALGRLPMNDRQTALKRMDATLGEQWALWRENRSTRKEKELPPFELTALHGAVLAQLPPAPFSPKELECPINRLVAFFTRWSTALQLRAKGLEAAGREEMWAANTQFRLWAYDEYGNIPGSAGDKYDQLNDEFNAARKRDEH